LLGPPANDHRLHLADASVANQQRLAKFLRRALHAASLEIRLLRRTAFTMAR
jgi:hypothetical protein